MTVQERVRHAVVRQAGKVVLRSELSGMGSASRVTKALRALQDIGLLVRIGTGIYAKTRSSSVTGATIPAGSLEALAIEALQKLGVPVTAGSGAKAYNAGETTQLPGQFVVNTGSRRIRRKIEVGGRTLRYENTYGR